MKKLTINILEKWILESTEILKNEKIPNDKYVNYILYIFSLRRINNKFDEDVIRLSDSRSIEISEAEKLTTIKIPESIRWKNILKCREDIGKYLDKVFIELEDSNKSIKGVFSNIKFENISDDTMRQLLSHFSKYSLYDSRLTSGDILGSVYEHLIKNFSDGGKDCGEFYTPASVVKLVTKLTDPKPYDTVYDPTCGSGGMLIGASKYVSNLEGGKTDNKINISLNGQELNNTTWSLSKLNMFIHGFELTNIENGNTLVNPKHIDKEGKLMKFDRIISNPPYSISKWWSPIEDKLKLKYDNSGKLVKGNVNYSKEVIDPHNRFKYAIAPRGYADMAFVQHIVASLKDEGKATIVLPLGTLFRGSTEGEIRKALILGDIVEGIIVLPSNIFYNTSIPTCVWVINRNKKNKNKTIFIDASDEFEKDIRRNKITDDQIHKIIDSYNGNKDIDKFMRIVDIKEIKENDYNLNIPRYIDRTEPEPEIDIKKLLLEYSDLDREESELNSKFKSMLNELGYGDGF